MRRPIACKFLALLFAAGLFAVGASSIAVAEETVVHGRVMGETAAGDHLGPVAGAKVDFEDAAGKSLGSTTTDAAGYYRIADLTPGIYFYELAAEGFRDEKAGRGLEVTEEGAHVLDFVLIQGADEAPTEEPRSILAVRVLAAGDDGNKPLPGAQLAVLFDGSERALLRRTLAQGRVQLPMTPGTCRVSATASGYETSVYPEAVVLAADGRKQIEIVLKPCATPEVAPGDGESTRFFGARATARRVVFVVDNSNSMKDGKFEAAAAELMKSVRSLRGEQKFYVIFFSNGMHPMFESEAPDDLIGATPANFARLEAFVADLGLSRGTRAHEAVDKALAMKPDVIYLLGDGAFTDDTAKHLLEMTGNPVPIHTIGFQAKERGAAALKQIAERHRGTYTYVP